MDSFHGVWLKQVQLFQHQPPHCWGFILWSTGGSKRAEKIVPYTDCQKLPNPKCSSSPFNFLTFTLKSQADIWWFSPWLAPICFFRNIKISGGKTAAYLTRLLYYITLILNIKSFVNCTVASKGPTGTTWCHLLVGCVTNCVNVM